MSDTVRTGDVTSLPHSRTRLIGREQELEAITRLVQQDDVALVTLIGPGGVGKTRLALAVASGLDAAFPGGIVFVQLAPLNDAALVVPAIAAALKVSEQPGHALLDQISSTIGDRELLLVLDNVEHVIAAASSVAALLAACPNLTVLTTSRTPLRLYDEREYPVRPLALPDFGNLSSAADLTSFGATALFIERAVRLNAEFSASDSDAATISEICQRLDGLPLAIELAAARTKMLSPQTLVNRLERRLPVLSGGARDLPARQQTMRDTIAWSYDLLTPDEQQLYRRLAIFVGGWTLDAAEACNHDLPVLDGISTLVDHSLVRQSIQPDGSTRFAMLETIREFGLEQLAQSGESGEAAQRHARYFLQLMTPAEPVVDSVEQHLWLNGLEVEYANLRVALDWAITNDAEAALRAAGGVWEFWLIHAHLSEGRRWLAKALASGVNASPVVRAIALDTAGGLASWQGDFESAQQSFEESLAIFRALDDRWNVANTLRGLARMTMAAGDYQRAHVHGTESVALFKALDDRTGIISALFNLGSNAYCQGQHARAIELLTESLDLAHEQGAINTAANISTVLGWAVLESGDPQQAYRQLTESLVLNEQTSDTRFVVVCLEGLGRVALASNQTELATRLFGAADAIRRTIGFPIENFVFMHQLLVHAIASARTTLGDERFAIAWAAGQAMTRNDAIALALQTETTSTADGMAQPGVASVLSPRELDVLRLLVDGRSNQEIGGALFISPHTVATHVANIMNKLGVESRTAAATYAIRHGLT